MSAEGCWVLWVCTAVGVIYVGKWTLVVLYSLLTWLEVALGSRLRRRNLAAEYGGKWAVVTGSTDGIGKEYAKQLAKKGMNIILVSRTPEKLKNVEQEIKKEFGVETHTIAADFSNGRQIYDGIAKVNNVGYFGLPQKFNEVAEDDIWRFVNVNTASVVAMTKIVLPQMLARKQGAIINISSIVAVCPVPRSAVYCATKAFVTYFSLALEFEYRDSGITVQTVQPGVVATNMTAYSKHFSKPDWFNTVSATTVVSNALRSLGYTKVTAGAFSHALQTSILELLPEEVNFQFYGKFFEFILNEGGPKKSN